jgi:hypothetical protein
MIRKGQRRFDGFDQKILAMYFVATQKPTTSALEKPTRHES